MNVSEFSIERGNAVKIHSVLNEGRVIGWKYGSVHCNVRSGLKRHQNALIHRQEATWPDGRDRTNVELTDCAGG